MSDNRFNDLKKIHLEAKDSFFKKVASGKEFTVYKNTFNDEFVLYDMKLDESLSIGKDKDFLELFRLLKKSIKLEDVEVKNE